MALYCMCQRTRNRYAAPQPGDDGPSFHVVEKMQMVKCGSSQSILEGSHPWMFTENHKSYPAGRRHYPNVDVYVCRHCGTIIVRDT